VILIDTSVWIDHLRSPSHEVNRLIENDRVLMHPMVIGELACGNMADRTRTLTKLKGFPDIHESSHGEVLALIESQTLMGTGVGYIDAHLICSALNEPGTAIWTQDSSLKKVASRLGLAYESRASS